MKETIDNAIDALDAAVIDGCLTDELHDLQYAAAKGLRNLLKPTLWQTLTSQQQWQTLWNMREYGGGFASNLASAWMVADSGNSARLANAFPDMVDKYNPLTSSYRVTEMQP